ncbi:ABC transporter permease [Kribbella sandramycini]|uniref:ABC transporter permease n=1 Tax=Kribbella sandramycini TaxID=60450 RepID=A0A7Y4L0D5_9ACTN|nr:ABC transporter permease [Kribbella sandramycini]MBB6565751.1 putative ABC transport system permease protein [Kribbella sandramycini]NOL42013.1 ABC transporter permease [Kribbella sandramycini]
MGSWGPPLRIARRTTRKSIGRTLLVAALIGLPVFAATWLGVTARSVSPTGETLARTLIGQADARVDVTSYSKLDTSFGSPTLDYIPGAALDAKEVRDPATFDPKPLLPAGTGIARPFADDGRVELKSPTTVITVGVQTGDGQSPLLAGTIQLDEGRFATAANEVAISPVLADHLGIGIGGTLSTAKGTQYQVVGLARTLRDPAQRRIFAAPGTTLVPPGGRLEARYLLDLPAAVDPQSLITPLAETGLYLLPRANIVDPPPTEFGRSYERAGPYAAMGVAIGFGVLEIVLLAGTAFAVGARRQTRELGLVLVAGGTARDVRRVVLLQGLFAGVVGVTAGLGTAALALAIARPFWDRVLGMVFQSWQIPWAGMVTIVLVGLLSGLAAAVIPAVNAGRQTPMAALSGRFAKTAQQNRIRLAAVLLVLCGVALVAAGSAMLVSELADARRAAAGGASYVSGVTPTVPIALVLLGITLAISGVIWMLPGLVGVLAASARRLPLSGRLAVRDAARHRHRTAPAAAAIMMSVAATAAAAFAGANYTAAEAAGYIPSGLPGNATLQFDFGATGPVPYSADLERRIAGHLPVTHTYRFGQVTAPDSPPGRPAYLTVQGTVEGVTGGYAGLLVAEPAYVERLGGEAPQIAARLRAGEIVLPQADISTTGSVRVGGDPDDPKQGVSHQASYVGALPPHESLSGQALISPDAAAKLGRVETYRVEYQLSELPTENQLAAVDQLLGHERSIRLEQGFQSTANTRLLWVLVAATVVTLIGVTISVSLSAAEGRADLATLAAVGASPHRRRNLAAAQAWVLGQLGCVLGVGVGALYGYTAHAAFGSPSFAVPWLELGAIVLAVPLFAALLAWVLTRSRLPMVARID